MTCALVIGLLATPASGAASTTVLPTVAASGHTLMACPTARQGLRFYTSRLNFWRGKMLATTERHEWTKVGSNPASHRSTCPRYLAKLMRSKAHAARVAYANWRFYHYRWDHWLPAKWYRIARCETGVNWRHSNSGYAGAFGFALSSWTAFRGRADPKAGPYPAEAWQATPRQQYEVALAIYRAFGFSGWGCRGA